MTRKSAAQTPEVPGIDLAFRPSSYFWPLSLETHLLARIKGAERKAGVQRMIDAGRLDEIPSLLLQSSLDDAVRQAAGRIHPAFMGGEYLPDMMSNEVAILSVAIASTTQDVTCVYARRCKNRIHYRVVDEYQNESLSGRTARTSTRPLTLGELESFFNDAWPIFDVLEGNFGDDGYDLDEMLDFVRVESQFYPDIARLYTHRITEWAKGKRAEVGLDQIDDEEVDAVEEA